MHTLQAFRHTKRQTVLHECGHLVASVLEGKRNVAAHIGQTTPGEGMPWDDAGVTYEPPASPVISVAGFAAVALQDDPSVTGEQCAAWVLHEAELGSRFLSAADREVFPVSRTEQVRAFDRALKILRANGELISWARERLDRNLKITSSEIRSLLTTANFCPAGHAAGNQSPCRISISDASTAAAIGDFDVNEMAVPRAGEHLVAKGQFFTVIRRRFLYNTNGTIVELHVAPGHLPIGESINSWVEQAIEVKKSK